MAYLQAYSCDAITGETIDRVPVSAFTYSRLMSAGDSGSSATIPLDGTFSKAALKELVTPWSRMLALERDGVVEYMGYVSDPPKYTRGASAIGVECVDIWSLLARRGGWDHSAGNVEQWKQTVTGSLADHAVAAIRRGRDVGPALPAMGMPLTLPGNTGGSIARTYYGYHLETVGDVLADLLDEGLDIYFQPRWITTGDTDWLMRTGVGWGSGVTREFYVTSEMSDVAAFTESGDAVRVTNNARYVGEGSEVDMLVRSARNVASPYPLLDRITQTKNISDVGQLAALANQDLVTYGQPTMQWEFAVLADSPVDVGDTVRLHFDGDPWIPDGWHTRRVVKVAASIPGPDVKTISVQPTGGA